MPSSIPAARLNLYTMLDGAAGLNAAQVTFGPPEFHSEERKVAAILGVENVTTEDATLGDGGQDERYVISMRLKVHDPSCNGSAAELQEIDAEIWGFYETIRATVQADRTLGGAVNINAIVSTAGAEARDVGAGESPVPAVTEDGVANGWVSFVDLRIDCHTRIT
jgi:hypothetical protein